jgi:hypothetical protein
MEKKLEECCAWFSIAHSMSNPEGYFKRCYHECDGYDTHCYEYVASVKIIRFDKKKENDHETKGQ